MKGIFRSCALLLSLFVIVISCSNGDSSNPAVMQGKVQISLSGLDIENESFTLTILSLEDGVVETFSNLQQVATFYTLEAGEYEFEVKSTRRNYETVTDLVFSGTSQRFNLNNGDTLNINIDIGLDGRRGWMGIPDVPLQERFAPSSFIIGDNI